MNDSVTPSPVEPHQSPEEYYICNDGKMDKSLLVNLLSPKNPGCICLIKEARERTCLKMQVNSPAFEVWKEFELASRTHSKVNYLPFPTLDPKIPLSDVGPVYQEVVGTLAQYCNCMMKPIPTDDGWVFDLSDMNAYDVLQHIQKGVCLPNISALASGTGITHLNVYYSDCIIAFTLHKV
jgi:hypothetical protein